MIRLHCSVTKTNTIHGARWLGVSPPEPPPPTPLPPSLPARAPLRAPPYLSPRLQLEIKPKNLRRFLPGPRTKHGPPRITSPKSIRPCISRWIRPWIRRSVRRLTVQPRIQRLQCRLGAPQAQGLSPKARPPSRLQLPGSTRQLWQR